MLKDQSTIQNPQDAFPLIKECHELYAITQFIDKHISGFKDFYNNYDCEPRENKITELLVNYFQRKIRTNTDGDFPFHFEKNPTQYGSDRETDMGVLPLTGYNKPLMSIFELEAKRLSNNKNHHVKNNEYVYGNRGGMERIKKGFHCSQHIECGMLGYMLTDDVNHWTTKINRWISERKNKDLEIDWSGDEEQLSVDSTQKTNDDIVICTSKNKRTNGLPKIKIRHYMINLT